MPRAPRTFLRSHFFFVNVYVFEQCTLTLTPHPFPRLPPPALGTAPRRGQGAWAGRVGTRHPTCILLASLHGLRGPRAAGPGESAHGTAAHLCHPQTTNQRSRTPIGNRVSDEHERVITIGGHGSEARKNRGTPSARSRIIRARACRAGACDSGRKQQGEGGIPQPVCRSQLSAAGEWESKSRRQTKRARMAKFLLEWGPTHVDRCRTADARCNR